MNDTQGHESSQHDSGAKLFDVTIVTPQGTRVEYRVRHLRAPGAEGDFGVLPGHVPFMTALRIGALVLETEQGKKVLATSGGFAEVLGDKVTLLAETIEAPDQIDVVRVEAAKKRALDRLAARTVEVVDVARANAALARAINRERVATLNRDDH